MRGKKLANEQSQQHSPTALSLLDPQKRERICLPLQPREAS